MNSQAAQPRDPALEIRVFRTQELVDGIQDCPQHFSILVAQPRIRKQLLLENPTGTRFFTTLISHTYCATRSITRLRAPLPPTFEGRFAIQIAGGRRRLPLNDYRAVIDTFWPLDSTRPDHRIRGRQAHPRADRSGWSIASRPAVVPTLPARAQIRTAACRW